MMQLQDVLQRTPMVYITRDIERAAGIPFETPGFFVITNATIASTKLHAIHANIICVQGDTHLDTHELLEHEQTKEWMHTHADAHILVFKNSGKIERICSTNNWILLNPSATLANTVEQKISQLGWLDELTTLLPPHQILTCKELSDSHIPCVVQFNHGHTGTGTVFVASSKELEYLHTTFPDRPARITKYIDGMMCTLNAVITSDTVLTSTISYQITGIKPFTDNPFATVGNDWVFPKKILSKEQAEQIHAIAKQVGNKLQASGWRGLFGIDVIVEKRTGDIFLIEINARQPASSSYESTLQSTLHPTTMEAHIFALLGVPVARIAPILSGAQLYDRRTDPPVVHHFTSGIIAEHGILSSTVARSLS